MAEHPSLLIVGHGSRSAAGVAEYWDLARVVSADAWRWQPHPEVWIPGAGSLETLEFVARNRYAYMGIPYFHISVFDRMFRLFREACENEGYTYDPVSLGVEAATDPNDHVIRHTFDVTHRNADRHETRIPPVKLFIGRIDASVRVFERRDHLAQHFVEFLSAVCFCGRWTECGALGLPVDPVEGWIVVAFLDCFPNVVEDREPAFESRGRNHG